MSAKYIIVVSEAMRRHIENKYRQTIRGQFVTLPIFQEIRVIDIQKVYPNNKPVIVYAGGLQTWQQIPKMINAMSLTMDYAHYVFLCPQPMEFQKMLPENLINNPNLEIDSKPFVEILDVYFKCHYGFILREDIIVNNVACPTKLMEYLAMGVVPIVDCEDIGDFKTLGMQYVKLPDLLMKNLPAELERKRMVENNFGVYRKLQEQYEIGLTTLKKSVNRKQSFITRTLMNRIIRFLHLIKRFLAVWQSDGLSKSLAITKARVAKIRKAGASRRMSTKGIDLVFREVYDSDLVKPKNKIR